MTSSGGIVVQTIEAEASLTKDEAQELMTQYMTSRIQNSSAPPVFDNGAKLVDHPAVRRRRWRWRRSSSSTNRGSPSCWDPAVPGRSAVRGRLADLLERLEPVRLPRSFLPATRRDPCHDGAVVVGSASRTGAELNRDDTPGRASTLERRRGRTSWRWERSSPRPCSYERFQGGTTEPNSTTARLR
jgi:hypothetical protein